MRILCILISLTGLVLTVVPPVLVLYQQITWSLHAQLLCAGMILWFVSAPFWIKTD